MGDWDTPPTEAEHAAVSNPWSTPPTPEEEHGGLVGFAHRAASWLPAIGGIGGGILGGTGGALGGAVTGPGAIATGALGAGVGGAMGGAAGKGLQHIIDTQLGYEKPIANASDLGSRVGDMGKSALEEGASNAVGTAAAGVVMPVVAKGARAVAGSMRTAANNLAARLPAGTAGDYAQMLAQDPESFQKLGNLLLESKTVDWGHLAPNAVAKRIPALAQKTGQAVEDSISALDAAGVRVPKTDAATKILNLAMDENGIPIAASERLGNKYLSQVQRMLNDIRDTGKFDMSMSEAENLKRKAYDPVVFGKKNPSTLQMGDHEIAKSILIANEQAAAKANPALAQKFLDAKEASGLAQKAADMAIPAQGRSEARGLIGPTARMGGYVGLVEAAAHGNPGLAATSILAPVAAQAAKTRSPGVAAMALKSTSDTLKSIASTRPQVLGPFGSILYQALNNGSGNDDEFNARSYALSQTEPGFQALTKQLSEQQKK